MMQVWRKPVAGGVLLLAVAAAGWFGWRGMQDKPASAPVASAPMANPWKPVTKPRDPACKQNCQEYAVRSGVHGAPVRLLLHDTDDEAYQWGSCFMGVLDCAESKGVNQLSQCVAQSECPKACKERYATVAARAVGEDALFKHFESVFIDPGAPCRPASAAGKGQ